MWAVGVGPELPQWVQGRVVEKCGEVSYRVKVGDQTWNRHADQLLACRGDGETAANTQELPGVPSGRDPGLPMEPPVTLFPVPRPEDTSPNTDLPEGELPVAEAPPVDLPSTVPVLGSDEPAPLTAALPDIPQATPVRKQYPRRNRAGVDRWEPTFSLEGEEM